ncbi:MAG: hypothetical protein J6X70_08225 [Muribaculaceae bacterium]|nr:hypothetical protein [Muribaculaceae bacterium]
MVLIMQIYTFNSKCGNFVAKKTKKYLKREEKWGGVGMVEEDENKGG